MKIERKQTEPKFEPIVITIESQAEFDALWIGMNHSFWSFLGNVPKECDTKTIEFHNARNSADGLWCHLNNLR